jgi:hypothetical protein
MRTLAAFYSTPTGARLLQVLPMTRRSRPGPFKSCETPSAARVTSA